MEENGLSKKEQMSFEEQKRLFIEIGLLAEYYQDDDESYEDDGCNSISGHWWNVACRELGHPEMMVEEEND